MITKALRWLYADTVKFTVKFLVFLFALTFFLMFLQLLLWFPGQVIVASVALFFAYVVALAISEWNL
jgi:hypothetical protein